MAKVLLILADDMRQELASYMPFVWGTLRANGAWFENARCEVPICQAARAAILSGQYAHHANNLTFQNSEDNTVAWAADSLPLWLQAEGVVTGMFGKGPNIYKTSVQPGWDEWWVLDGNDQEAQGYTVRDVLGATSTPAEHAQTYFADRVVDFITANAASEWFVWYNPTQPHVTNDDFSNQPMPSDMNRFRWKRWPFVLTEDVSTRPTWIQARTGIGYTDFARTNYNIQQQLRELQGLDRAVETIYDALVATDQLDDTVIIFVSDNGIFFGEQRQTNTLASKDEPYSPASRTPLIVSGPGFEGAGTNPTPVNIQDIVATIVDIFVATGTDLDGTPLSDFITAPDPERAVLYQRKNNTTLPDAAGVFTHNRILVRYTDGTPSGSPIDLVANPTDEYELFYIDEDPDEQTNRAFDGGAYLTERNRLEALLDALLA